MQVLFESIVRDILLSGIYDIAIRPEVLSNPSMLNKSINNIICIIEGKESTRNAVASSTPTQAAKAAAASLFKSRV